MFSVLNTIASRETRRRRTSASSPVVWLPTTLARMGGWACVWCRSRTSSSGPLR
jgi:hypothetical protein